MSKIKRKENCQVMNKTTHIDWNRDNRETPLSLQQNVITHVRNPATKGDIKQKQLETGAVIQNRSRAERK